MQLPTVTKENMKMDLIDWYSVRASISIGAAKRFIRLLAKESYAFNVFMDEYWKYFIEAKDLAPKRSGPTTRAIAGF